MAKIIHFISSLSRGGRERQLATIVSKTEQWKHSSLIVYLNIRENSYIDEYNLYEQTKHVRSVKLLARLIELHQLLKKQKPDIVISWGNMESVMILLLKPFHSFKFVNGSIRHGVRANKLSHYFRSFILHLSRNVVANSYAGLRANNLKRGQVLYNGIDEKFTRPLQNHKALREKLTGIPDDIPILISVGNLVPYKDYLTVLDALIELNKEKFSFYYLILGDGPMRSTIEEKLEKNSLKDNIKVTGNVDNVFDYLKISDVFIHSSRGEGCSNAILEAMAAGLPVIASKTGGTQEIVTQETGFLFEYKNTNDLSDKLKFCLNNKDHCQEYGEKGQDNVKYHFTVQKMMENYYSIINSILKR